MKTKRFIVCIGTILAIILSPSLADSSNEIDSNKQNKKIHSAPPPFAKFTNLQKFQIFSTS